MPASKCRRMRFVCCDTKIPFMIKWPVGVSLHSNMLETPYDNTLHEHKLVFTTVCYSVDFAFLSSCVEIEGFRKNQIAPPDSGVESPTVRGHNTLRHSGSDRSSYIDDPVTSCVGGFLFCSTYGLHTPCQHCVTYRQDAERA